jgi:CO/xanthine dehydrogenase FAD-binding subunit
MPEESSIQRIFRPRSLSWLLELAVRHPDALIYAGGTAIYPGRRRLPEKILYLGKVGELSRIARTVRSLEIGAFLSLTRILSTGRSVLPAALSAALQCVATPPVRSLATLGGNVCSAWSWNDALPPLYAIDAQVEVRSVSASRWMNVGAFITGPGQTVLHPGEVLTRIRVPLEDWSYQVYRRVSRHRTASRGLVSLCGLARFSRRTIEAFRLALGGVGGTVFRSRELEVRIEGGRLPLPAGLTEVLINRLEEQLNPVTDAYSTGRYRKATALRLVRWFLQGLTQRSLEMM